MKSKHLTGNMDENSLTLRKKTMLIIGATLVCLIVILYFTTSAIMIGGFSQVEKQDAHKNVQRVQEALSDDIAELDLTVGNWANWDETYAFIKDGNEEYIKSYLYDNEFNLLKVNLMLFINSSDGIVFAKGFYLQDMKEIPISQGLLQALLPLRPGGESGLSGLIVLPEGAIMIAARPILTSEGKGQSRGTLIMGRFVDAAEVEHLSGIVHLNLTLSLFEDPEMPSDFQAARDSFSEETTVVIQPLDERSIAGYALLKDLSGRPALMLRVDMPRDINDLGKAGVRYLLFSLIAIGLIFGAVVAWLLEKLVLSRLARLNDDVSSIGASGEISGRVSVESRDELSSLAGAINRMLDALEHSQTESRRAEEALQERERFLNNIFSSIQDGISVLDSELNIIRVNPAMERWYAHAMPLVGKKCYLAYHGRNKPCEVCPSRRTIETGEAAVEEVPRRGAGGEITGWLDLFSFPLVDKGTGKITGVIEYVRDITEEKKAEELKLENMRLTLASKAKSDFLTTMSHELRTPLNSIIGFSELLKQAEMNEKHKHYVDNVLTSGKHLLGLINDILDISSVEAGKIELRYEKISIPVVLDETLFIIKETAANHHVLLKKDLDPDLEFIEADVVRLRQILFNLISNGVKFSKQEGGTVTITSKKEGDMAKISVSDTGIGIKAEDLGRLFNEFEQLDSGISRRYGGTGLGLAITNKLVELQGGTLTAMSRYGEGSTFTFTLPIETKKEGA